MSIYKQLFQSFLLLSLVFGQSNQAVEPFLADELNRIPAVRDLTLSSNGDEAYFTAQSPLGELGVIMVIEKGLLGWKDPEIATFSGKYSDLEPFLTEDGLHLYFASDRPNASSYPDSKNFDLWVVDRKTLTSTWSDPVNLGPPINSEHNEFYPSLAASGNLYFTTDRPGTLGKDDILVSRFRNGQYGEPVSVSDSINSEGYEFNAFVAPDESYLLFTAYNRSDGFGSGDLYISRRDKQGLWSAAENLGPDINSKQMDYCPFVINNILYFTSRRSTVESPDAGFASTRALMDELNKHSNGQSRLYKGPFKE